MEIHAERVLHENTATGIRGVLLDLTPNRRAQEERERLEAQLQQAQKMEAIGALAGGIAHDFNNILSAIIGYTELAMLNEGAEHCQAELKQALLASNRARDLIKQILAFSRQTDEERMPIRVGLVTKECVKFLRATIPSTIAIKTRIDEKSGTVLANSVELHQIIMNLCTNALHAIGDRGGTLEIAVEETEIDEAQKQDTIGLEVGPYVRVSVKDTGGGIPPEILGKIFDPYFTTKAKGVGTGLGLAVVHGIVRKSGGAIQVESVPDHGTTFHILLPRVDQPSAQQVEQIGVPVGGSERILFVDDETMLAGIGQQMLKRLGYDVVARTSPIEALELFKAKPEHFDLVVTDQTMPGMTGDALAREMMRIRPGLPVIICTGYSQSIDERKAFEMGIRGFVMKPILINRIAVAIRTALAGEALAELVADIAGQGAATGRHAPPHPAGASLPLPQFLFPRPGGKDAAIAPGIPSDSKQLPGFTWRATWTRFGSGPLGSRSRGSDSAASPSSRWGTGKRSTSCATASTAGSPSSTRPTCTRPARRRSASP